MPHVKLTPPQTHRKLVQRKQLENWIQSAQQTRLVVFRAPAGFGKTTIMTQWLSRVREMGRVTAWLTLDKTDNDPHRFLANLLASIQIASPEFIFEGSDLDQSPQGTNPEGIILYLVDQLSASSVPLTVFLDDFGVINNPEVEAALQQLIDLMPADKRFIISMRETPNLELGRFRSKGDVIEIDAQGLCFDREEVCDFLRQTHDLDVPEVERDWLFNSTEGWVAGMRECPAIATVRVH